MASLNKVIIIGNVGQDPEMRFTPSGKPATSFTVAVNDKHGEENTTEWFNVVTWQRQAETCNQFLSKGSLVYVEGRQQTRKWEGQDGQTHYKTELIASRVVFLDRKQKQVDTTEIEPEDIPF